MATRQQRYHESMEKKGFKRVQVWVHETQVERLRTLAAGLVKEHREPDDHLPSFLKEQAH